MEGFNEQWDKHAGQIKRHCQILGRRHRIDWEDLYSETYLRLHKKDVIVTHFVTYAQRAASWLAADMRKKSYWGKRFGVNPPAVMQFLEHDTERPGQYDSENLICDRLAAADIIEGLPENLRSILRDIFSGMSHREIGERVGYGRSAVTAQLFRMRERLRLG